ncbi:nucleoporin Nup43 [Sitodiplosis mosellana]|uniref:nucleoporin Nup43 n=1 Tax=Sitodiplosis mosellana TaxID=263140 RepID=UPI002443EA58|nr:nucleoporin Nup43 [Sitodiplosis mosellana]
MDLNSSSDQVNCSFVSEKVSKIRFVQEKYKQADTFITGGWGSDSNTVGLWKLTKDELSNDENEVDYTPKSISKVKVDGDVTGLEFLNSESIVCTTSSDNVQLLLINLNHGLTHESITVKHQIEQLHKYKTNTPAVCSGLSVHETNIATVGEDGSLHVLSSQGRIVKSFQHVDSCAISSVAFVNHNEIFTGNRIGIINVFDVRNTENKPSTKLVISTEDDKRSNCVTCITYHPNQNHIVLCGSEEGTLTIWDLRQPAFPASYYTVHEKSSVSDVAFHRTDPTKLFTSSESGELFQWSHKAQQITERIDGQLTVVENENINPWLCGQRTKSRINLVRHLEGIGKAINCFDTSSSRVICGCDNEAIYLINNV